MNSCFSVLCTKQQAIFSEYRTDCSLDNLAKLWPALRSSANQLEQLVSKQDYDAKHEVEPDFLGAPVKLSQVAPEPAALPYSVPVTAVIDQPSQIGAGVKIWHFSPILKNCRIGDNTTIGQNVVIGPEVTIGRGCKVQNTVSVYQGVTLEDDVFCGPSLVFTNVFNPRAHIRRMDEVQPTLVETGASIGANATIVCGHTIGRYAFVGAGAVVTKDVPDYALVAATRPAGPAGCANAATSWMSSSNASCASRGLKAAARA